MNVFKMFDTVIGPGASPRPFQMEVWEKLQSYRLPQVLIAPTGSGKTEAVVFPFLFQFVSGNFFLAPRLIYVLPTRAIADDLHQRLADYAAKINPKIKVELFHGTEHPEMPVFMGDIVITTLDQFIYGYSRSTRLVGRHLDMPAGSIASSFVVFDEAHLYHSPYTFSHLRAMLEILAFSQVPFCLMTATMPQSLLDDLFKNCDYETIQADYTTGQRRIKWEMSDLNIEDLIAKNISQTNKILVVVNTIQKSQEIFRRFQDDSPVLLHSRFFPEDRAAHTEVVREKLGRKGSGGLVVSTQVLEAGVNISADCLITETAPADSLIQRIGRCARFGGDGKVVIKMPSNTSANSLLAPPYENNFIDATLLYLQNRTQLEFSDFSALRDFTNNLNYQCDDYAAQNSLIDLLQATMYADNRPRNLQIREGKSITLFFPENSGDEAIYTADFQKVMNIPYKSVFKIAEEVLFTMRNKQTNKLQIFQLNIDGFKDGKQFMFNDKNYVSQVNLEDCLPGKIYLAKLDKYSSSEGLIHE